MLLESLLLLSDLGTGLRVTEEEEVEGGGMREGGDCPDTAVSDTPGRLASRKAEDDLILLSALLEL